MKKKTITIKEELKYWKIYASRFLILRLYLFFSIFFGLSLMYLRFELFFVLLSKVLGATICGLFVNHNLGSQQIIFKKFQKYRC